MKTLDIFIDQTNKYNVFKRLRSKKDKDSKVLNFLDFWKSAHAEFDLPEQKRTWSLLLFACAVIVFVFIFLGRIVFLQVINKDIYTALANQNRIRKVISPAERGVIYDRNKTVIARNKPSFSLVLNTNACSLGSQSSNLCKLLIEEASKYVYIDKDRAFKQLTVGTDNILLAAGISKDNLLQMEANVKNLKGLSIETFPQRDYIYNEAFAHLIGYTGLGTTSLEVEGKMGIEKSYNEYLTGVLGSRIVQVDSRGAGYTVVSEELSLPGKDITLFIDADLQNKAYELLKKVVDEKKAAGGAVVALDPQNGGVLALVSYPSFDSAKISGGISAAELAQLNSNPSYPFFNRAISAVYPPGSTFKMVVAAAALVEKIVTEYTVVNDPGFIQVGSYIFRNWKLTGHGDVTLTRALQVSNDVYFYTVGGGYGGIKGLGIEKLYDWATKFGFGRQSGIDMEGEATGFMPDGISRDWYLGDTYITSIGQGDVLATPLQVTNMTAYFANDGYIYKPRIVKYIDGVGETSPEIKVQRLMDAKTYYLVREGMKMAVSPGGTAYPLFDFPVRHKGVYLGGKTGTSEYFDSNGKPKTHAWFTVFGPYDNANIALTVFLEGGGSGSDDAAPIAKELLDVWFNGHILSTP